MVIKNGEHETAREIFERMINLGLGPKKMKSLFKKYWEFEQTHGDQTKVDAVRKKSSNISTMGKSINISRLTACTAHTVLGDFVYQFRL